MSLDYKFESLQGTFPRDLTPPNRRNSSPFGKTWTEVQEILQRELRAVGFRTGSVVIQTAHSPYDVRKDGKLRNDVRRPEHPGVVLKFETYNSAAKRYDRMSFECDQFTEWKANVRAIADAMEALRKINRYGVSGGGNTNAHYEGYKSLPEAKTELQTAAEFISGYSEFTVAEVLMNDSMMTRAYRKAAQILHPDKNGSHELFVQLQKAKEILEKFYA